MNEARRKALNALKDRVDSIKEDLENLKDEEQETFDNLPEGLQSGEKGEAMQNAIDNIEAAMNGLEDVVSYIESAGE